MNTKKLVLEIKKMQDALNITSTNIIKHINRNEKIMQKSDKNQKKEHDELLNKIKEVERFNLTLEEKVNDRTMQLKDEQKYVNSIINAQSSILIITDGIFLKSANQSFFDFYNIKNEKEFVKKYGDCICDTFNTTSEEQYIKKIYKGLSWIDYVTLNQNQSHKTKIIQENKEYIFEIKSNEFVYKNKLLKVVVFNDITTREEIRIKIENANKKISILFNNVGQGFLYFDKHMNIGSEYSKEVYSIFKIDVTNKKINELLYEKKKDQDFLALTLEGILKDNSIRQEILISLLKKEFLINDKYIELEYKILDENTCMLILTDISSKKELEAKIKKENQILKMIVELVGSLEQFIEIKSGYINLILFINDYKEISKLPELKRQIHTFKGLFAQKEMLNIVQELHYFEEHINESIDKKELTMYMKDISFNIMNEWIEKDISIIKNILGEDFFLKSNFISIDKNRIGKLQAKISLFVEENNINNKQIDEIKKNIEELKYNSVKTLFRPYEKLVDQLSIRFNKEVYPLVLNGENIYLNNIYKSFINSLVHIFRNSVDHGIEDIEKRYELKKDLKAKITCDVLHTKSNVVIKISDDGSGIDIDIIKKKAIDKKLFTKEQISNMNENEILMIIFNDNFSTSNTITDISGRGIGLSSVISELNKLNGSIDIKNKKDVGIEFIFTLPIDLDVNNEIDLLTKLSSRTISYFTDICNINLNDVYEIKEIDFLNTNNTCVSIQLTNDMYGTVYMGLSDEFALELVKGYIDDTMSADEKKEMAFSNLAEVLNITLGNILKDLNITVSGGIVGIEAPILLNNNVIINKNTNSKILLSKLKYKKENIFLGYFI